MGKVSKAFLSVAAGTLLACLGFFLTGVLAAKIDPQALGVSAVAAYPVLMFLAWGLPAALLWFAVATRIKASFTESALIGLAVEALIFACLTLSRSATKTELSTLSVLIAWPVGFVAVLSILGYKIGSKFEGKQHA